MRPPQYPFVTLRTRQRPFNNYGFWPESLPYERLGRFLNRHLCIGLRVRTPIPNTWIEYRPWGAAAETAVWQFARGLPQAVKRPTHASALWRDLHPYRFALWEAVTFTGQMRPVLMDGTELSVAEAMALDPMGHRPDSELLDMWVSLGPVDDCE